MKKIYSLSKTLAVAALTLLMATACSEGYEYVPDNETAGKVGQVYFEQSLPSTVELDIDDSEFEVTVHRANTEGEVIVKLNTTQPEPAIYNVPENVTFADGSAMATFKVTVNPDDLVYDDIRELVISIDEEHFTPYGNRSYTIQVGVPAPWTPWCSNAEDFEAAGGVAEWPLGEVGTGTYTFFGLMLTGSAPEVPVEFRQNKLTGVCQFRFVELATDLFPGWSEVVMDAIWMEQSGVYQLRLPQTYTGYFHPNYPGDEIFVMDYLSYAEMMGTEVPWDQWEALKPEVQSWYNPETGLFNLSVYYAISLGAFGNTIETLQMDGFYVPDYSVSVAYSGIYTGADGKVAAVANATLGVDAQDVRAIVTPQGLDVQSVADAMVTEESSEAFPWVSVSESGTFSVPFDPTMMGGEKLQIVVATIVDDAAVSTTNVTFEYYAGEKPWKSLGIGLFTDDIVFTTYATQAPTYEVEILEHKDNPGLYRLVDPYAKDVHPYGAALEAQVGATMAPEGCYLEVNAQDPNAVYISNQGLGFTDGSYGEFSFCTYPVYAIAMGWTDYESAKANGLFGTQEDGIITFTKLNDEEGGTMQGVIYAGGSPLTYGGTTSGIEIVLPDAVTPEMSAACAKSRVMRSGLRRKTINTYDSKKLHLNPMVSYMTPKSFKN